MSSFARIKRAGALNGLNVAVLVLGFTQQLLVVTLHGAGAATDRYFLLIVLPQVLVNLVGNVLNNAILPELVAADRGGGGAASLFVRYRAGVAWWALGLVGLAGVVGYLQLGRLETVAGDGGLNSPIVWVGLAAVTVWPGLLANFHATRLNAAKLYVPPMALLGLPPALGMAVGYLGRDAGVGMFLAGQILGAALQLWILARLAKRYMPEDMVRDAQSVAPIRGLAGKIGLLLLLGAGYQFLPVMERSFAALTEAGTVTVVALASRLGGMLSPALAAGASVMLFTELADLASRGETATAARHLFGTLRWFQLILAAVILVGPALMPPALNWFISDQILVDRLASVLPDYLTAGAMGACGLIVGRGCYVLLARQQFQVVVAYIALGLYFGVLSWARGHMTLELIALANVGFWILSISAVSVYLSYRIRWVGIRACVFGQLAMVGAWLFSRGLY